ncbi:glycine zipper 2TM domain-containing protein [Parahaliea mediterranea]|uniref:Glycine zipper 2TM domain-containing protein n=1 Tax=Parahaliea mediterranea TaxID=651086 RepID=A0A939DGV8_9GAMM|nr:hypothetical protein [Parahaliea mediterranea]MBN7797844.1 hypothetical protein [Parahaliea mediterranea]
MPPPVHTAAGIGIALLLGAAPLAGHAQSHYVDVPVVEVEPLLRTVTDRIPHERCYDERVKLLYAGPHSPTPGLVGALVGGSVAGALGHNSRKQPLIAGMGALVGASIGTDMAHRHNARARYLTERRCEVDYELRDRREVSGYRVAYRYGDSIYHTRMDYRPGDTIRLRVDLQPVH